MEGIKDLTECCICARMLTDPRMLPCIHTFCLKCLQLTALNTQKKPGDKMPCPLCSKDFTVPVDELTGLQKNFFMAKLVEVAKISTPPAESPLCEICNSDSKNEAVKVPMATMFCIECHQNICIRCSDDHRRYKPLMKHHIVPLGSQMKEELAAKLATRYCDLHDEKQMEMYCLDCSHVICMMCFAESHQFHKCSDVKKVADGFRKQIDASLEKLMHCSKKALAKRVQLKDEEANFRKNLDNTEQAIIDRGREIKELVDRCTQSLLEELKIIKEERSKKMAYDREEMENIRLLIESFKAYCTELKSNGSACDICLCVHDLEARDKELQEMQEINIKRPTSSVKLFWEILKLEEFIKTKNIVGKITITSPPEVDRKSPSGPNIRNFEGGISSLKQILVRMENNTRLITLNPTDDIDAIFVKVSNLMHGINPQDFMLIFEDYILEYGAKKKLSDYHLTHLSTLGVAIRLH